MRREAGRSGASLIEVLIVLAVLAVVVGLALPRLNTSAFRADTNARQVKRAVSYARDLALAEGAPVLVSLDSSGHQIRILVDSDSNGAPGSQERVHWRSLTGGGEFHSPGTGLSGTGVGVLDGGSGYSADSLPSFYIDSNGRLAHDIVAYLAVAGARGKVEARAVHVAAPSLTPTTYSRTASGRWRRSDKE